MLHDWISSKVTRIRQRFDHQELSEQSTSSASSSSSSTSAPPHRAHRSQSAPRVGAKKDNNKHSRYYWTPETMDEIARIIRQKMVYACYETLLENSTDPNADVCGSCWKRVAKFRGDTCDHPQKMCKYCAYDSLLGAIQSYSDGPLSATCSVCYSTMTGIVKVRRATSAKPISENAENVPTRESTSRSADLSISFSDYAASMLHETGCVNEGFSRNSF